MTFLYGLGKRFNRIPPICVKMSMCHVRVGTYVVVLFFTLNTEPNKNSVVKVSGQKQYIYYYY